MQFGINRKINDNNKKQKTKTTTKINKITK